MAARSDAISGKAIAALRKSIYRLSSVYMGSLPVGVLGIGTSMGWAGEGGPGGDGVVQPPRDCGSQLRNPSLLPFLVWYPYQAHVPGMEWTHLGSWSCGIVLWDGSCWSLGTKVMVWGGA